MKLSSPLLYLGLGLLTAGYVLCQESTTTVPEVTEKNATTRPPLTGNPQKDYLFDPNLPYELKGYNLSDYPFYNGMPEDITFKCDGLHDGFYASIPHGCQVYHQCLFGIRYDFLCANYTAFDQKNFICHFVSEIDCKNSEAYFDKNEALYKDPTTTSTTTYRPPERVRPAVVRRPAQGGGGGRRRPSRPLYYDYYDYYDGDYYDYYEDEVHSSTTTTTTPAPAKRAKRPRKRLRQPIRQRFGGEGRRRQFFNDESPPPLSSRRQFQGPPPGEQQQQKGGDFNRNDLFKQARVPPKINPPVPVSSPESFKNALEIDRPRRPSKAKLSPERSLGAPVSELGVDIPSVTEAPRSNSIQPGDDIDPDSNKSDDYEYYQYDDDSQSSPKPAAPLPPPPVKPVQKIQFPSRRTTQTPTPAPPQEVLPEIKIPNVQSRKPFGTSGRTAFVPSRGKSEPELVPQSPQLPKTGSRSPVSSPPEEQEEDAYDDYYYEYETDPKPKQPPARSPSGWAGRPDTSLNSKRPPTSLAGQLAPKNNRKSPSFATRGQLQFGSDDDYEDLEPVKSQPRTGFGSRGLGQFPGQERQRPNAARNQELLPQASGIYRARSPAPRYKWFDWTDDKYVDY